jgi:hypothetical protein
MLVAATLAAPLLATPAPVAAEGLFDFFFGGMQQRPQRDVPQQASPFVDPFASQSAAQPQNVPSMRSANASGPAFCVRSCDGKYFPLMRGLASPAQMCQAFCPASATKVYFGSSIDGAYSQTGARGDRALRGHPVRPPHGRGLAGRPCPGLARDPAGSRRRSRLGTPPNLPPLRHRSEFGSLGGGLCPSR